MKQNPPHSTDTPMVADLASIGIVPGRDFDLPILTQLQLEAVNEGMLAASARVESFGVHLGKGNPGWIPSSETLVGTGPTTSAGP